MLLSAVLIVRDEIEDLARCLESLRPFCDELLVHDTGSVDGTQALARELGARVTQGHWDGDFARARNAAAEPAAGPWWLVVDADEVAAGDPAALRARLQASGPGTSWDVSIRNATATGGWYAHRASRLVPAGTRWVGRVHERPVPPAGVPAAGRQMPEGLLRLDHHGYADEAALVVKGRRNAELALAELDAVREGGDLDEIGGTLLGLGRSLIGAGDRQGAVDALELLRELAPAAGPLHQQATDHLARVLLAAGMDEVVVHLADELEQAGAPRDWCRWLRGQALAQLGRPEEAWRQLAGVRALVDTAGRHYDREQLDQVRSLVRRLTGAVASR